MPSMSESLLQELVATIVREVNPDTVILFGSQARGDARPDSDVDILIVDPDSPRIIAAARRPRACIWPCANWGWPRICCSSAEPNSNASGIPSITSSAVPIVKAESFMGALEHTRGLLVMARKDFDALRGMIDNPPFADETFGFHAQPAIEKSLTEKSGQVECQAEKR